MLLVVHSATNWLLFYDWTQLTVSLRNWLPYLNSTFTCIYFQKLSAIKAQRASTFRSSQQQDSQPKSAVMTEGMASILLTSIAGNQKALGTKLALGVNAEILSKRENNYTSLKTCSRYCPRWGIRNTKTRIFILLSFPIYSGSFITSLFTKLERELENSLSNCSKGTSIGIQR